MTDTVPEIPAQQTTPVQQAAPAIDWEARYKGASQKINELMTQVATLQAQLSTNASELEQLRSSLSIKEVEKDAADNSYRTQLETAMTTANGKDAELRELRALKAKVNTAQKLNAPHLMPILDKIPFVEDPAAMEEVMKTFLDWGKDLVQKREEQLLAGVTPPPAATVVPQKALPTTPKDWEAYVNSFPMGSAEREQAYSQWWKSASQQS